MCPGHKKFLEDMFLCNFEEVRIMIMKHHKKPIEGLEILQKDGKPKEKPMITPGIVPPVPTVVKPPALPGSPGLPKLTPLAGGNVPAPPKPPGVPLASIPEIPNAPGSKSGAIPLPPP